MDLKGGRIAFYYLIEAPFASPTSLQKLDEVVFRDGRRYVTPPVKAEERTPRHRQAESARA